MLLAEEIQLVPDKTIFFQLGLFLIVAVVLNHFVFQPILKIIHLRKSRTEGDKKKIEEISQKTQDLMAEYEKKIQDARVTATQIKEGLKREGDEQGRRVVHEAKQASLAQIDKIKTEIQASSKKAQDDLESQSKALGKSIAEKVLGRNIN